MAIHLSEPCLNASCIETRSAGPKISEIGSAGRPLSERCSLGGAPLFTLPGLRGFLARRRYVWAISAMQDSRAIVSAMGQHIPQRVLSQPVSVPWVAIRETVNATPYRHDLKIHLEVRERRRARIGFIRLLDGRAVIISDSHPFRQPASRGQRRWWVEEKLLPRNGNRKTARRSIWRCAPAASI